jgi:hypothetical protein
MLPSVEVYHPKSINIKQYLSTDNVVLLEAGASLSTVATEVIKPSVKIRQSNINHFK